MKKVKDASAAAFSFAAEAEPNLPHSAAADNQISAIRIRSQHCDQREALFF